MREGGAESLITDYARLIDKSRFEVIIVSVNPIDQRSPYARTIKDIGGQIESIFKRFPVARSYIGQKLWNRFIHKKYVSNKLLSIIHKYNAKVVHVHLEILYFLSPISNKLNGIKIFYTCHSTPSRYFNLENRKRELLTAQKLIKNNDFRMIALHQEMKNELDGLFHVSNTIVIHNGVDFSKFNIIEGKEEIRKKLGIPEDAFLVGHVGRFAEAKNHSFIVDVFKKVLSKCPNAFLLLVGTGPLMADTNNKLVQNNLEGHYLILSYRTDIPRIMKAMDVFLFPSLYEGLPVTLVEAQVSGLRCVVSDVINSESFFLPSLVSLSLKKNSTEWAEVVLDSNVSGNYHNDISVFNMNEEIKKLEKIYLGEEI